MPVLVHKYKLAYFAVPKAANTTVKTALFELEHGRPFRSENFDGKTIHTILPRNPASARDPAAYHGYWKFTVFRDPIKRIISAYSNRIVHFQLLERRRRNWPKAWLMRLSLKPCLDEFCIKLVKYRKLSRDIRQHTRPYSKHGSADIGFFDAVYQIENLDLLATDLMKRTGQKIEFGRHQTGGPKFSVDDLSPAALDALLDYTKLDYDFLNGLYTPPPPKQR